MNCDVSSFQDDRGWNQLWVQINGEKREVADGLQLDSLIKLLNLTPERIAIELNQKVVRRAEWSATVVSEEDRVEIVHFVGGGAGAQAYRRQVLESLSS